MIWANSVANVDLRRSSQSFAGTQSTSVPPHDNCRLFLLLGEFVEVESGKRNDRPELNKAIATCKKHKAKLVITKLDRLARNVHLISGLMESKVDFVCCDMPDANRLTIHILAAVAEHERKMISERSKVGLAAARARGVKLCNQALADANKAAAAARDASLETVLRELRGRSYREIAAELTSRAIVSPRGGARNAMTVMRAMKRLGIANPTQIAGRVLADGPAPTSASDAPAGLVNAAA